MWTCPNCHQQFLHTNQRHSCNDKTVEDFLKGKSEHTLALFQHFIEQYSRIGEFMLHPAKSRISLASQTRFCAINHLGKNFIDVAFQFDQPFYDNLVFHKVSHLPGEPLWNHHCRIYNMEDVNEELIDFMQLAYQRGRR